MPLAIVIPVGPGDSAWAGLLPSLATVPAAEITAVLPSDRGAQAVPRSQKRLSLTVAPAGRARQQNAGAAATSAPWLWFLHADSRLDPGTIQRPDTEQKLRDFMAENPRAIGYFDLRFLNDGPALMRLNTLGAGLRSRWLGLPFGDQGLLMPRTVFQQLGGFDESVPGGEDHALIWRAHERGIPVRPVGAALYTSARKYAEHGWLKTTARHLWLTWQQARTFKQLARHA